MLRCSYLRESFNNDIRQRLLVQLKTKKLIWTGALGALRYNYYNVGSYMSYYLNYSDLPERSFE